MHSPQALQQLRQLMAQQELDAFLLPSTDPHDSEYPAPHWQCRAWLSGFTGSAGTLLVSATKAALWTDSRYYLQAEAQLQGSDICLMRDGEASTPNFAQWLLQQLPPTATHPLRVAFVGEMTTFALVEGLRTMFATASIEVVFVCLDDVFATLWHKRPALPQAPIYLHDLQYTARSCSEKLAAAWAQVPTSKPKACLLINDLSEIAWLLNLRGADIAYNPLFYAYLTITQKESCLYTHSESVPAEVRHYLSEQGVALREYAEIFQCFAQEDEQATQFFHTPSLNYALLEAFAQAFQHLSPEKRPHFTCIDSPIALLRACKDKKEIAGFRKAMIADGVAMVKFLRWLEEQVQNDTLAQQTEYSISEQLLAYRSENPDFLGNSFATIAAYRANGAIVHYEAQAHSAATLQPESLLLLDSGAQYRYGTTDLTRTIALGALSTTEQQAYTLVLKGMISLSRAKFPRGTRGIQLDTAARYAMWQAGYDYGHGTSHGVGSHLCVHEGPMQLRKELRANTSIPLQEGMVLSNEPGIYVAEKFGVRIENLILIGHDGKTDFGDFLHFDTLTLCPIDTRPIIWEWLDEAERAWLKDYHTQVCELLLPELENESDRRWLLAATATP